MSDIERLMKAMKIMRGGVNNHPDEIRPQMNLLFSTVFQAIKDSFLYPFPVKLSFIECGTAQQRYQRRRDIERMEERDNIRQEARDWMNTEECHGMWNTSTGGDFALLHELLKKCWRYIELNNGESEMEKRENSYSISRKIVRGMGEFEVR